MEITIRKERICKEIASDKSQSVHSKKKVPWSQSGGHLGTSGKGLHESTQGGWVGIRDKGQSEQDRNWGGQVCLITKDFRKVSPRRRLDGKGSHAPGPLVSQFPVWGPEEEGTQQDCCWGRTKGNKVKPPLLAFLGAPQTSQCLRIQIQGVDPQNFDSVSLGVVVGRNLHFNAGSW